MNKKRYLAVEIGDTWLMRVGHRGCSMQSVTDSNSNQCFGGLVEGKGQPMNLSLLSSLSQSPASSPQTGAFDFFSLLELDDLSVDGLWNQSPASMVCLHAF